jgi:four helix bundle protein
MAYQVALELVQLVARTRIGEAQLRAQARKSVASAALNTAEGAARQTLADKSRAYAIALAECCECCAAVEIAGALALVLRATCRRCWSWARGSRTCSAGWCAEPQDMPAGDRHTQRAWIVSAHARRGKEANVDGDAAVAGAVVPARHPIRQVKRIADAVLAELSPTLDAMYSAIGRPSIPPERLLKATVFMALFTVRSERQDVASKFFYAVVEQAQRAQLTSSDHFTVDGTLIDAWASLKSFKSKEKLGVDKDPPHDPGNPRFPASGRATGRKRARARTVPVPDGP